MNREDALKDLAKHKIANIELIDFILGDFLGYGVSRLVFDYNPDPKYVIKIDTSTYNANALEFHIWNDVKETKYAKWFAPIKHMSPCGRILLQRKCKFDHLENYPTKIPEFMSDIKSDNFGWLNGQFVCVDYAGSNLITTGLTDKMKTVKWIY